MAQMYGMGFTAPGGADPNTYTNVADPLGTGTGTDTGANPLTGEQQNFKNVYYWSDPVSAVGKTMADSGYSTDVNNSFYNAMADLAPGLKLMSLFGGGATGGIGNFMGNLGGWLNSGTSSGNAAAGGLGSMGGFGGLGNLTSLLGTLMNGGGSDPGLAGYIDQLTPQQILQDFGSMIGAAGYGQIAPELLSGIGNNLKNIGTQFGINGADLLSAKVPGQSDADIFLNYMKNNAGSLLGYLGL